MKLMKFGQETTRIVKWKLRLSGRMTLICPNQREIKKFSYSADF